MVSTCIQYGDMKTNYYLPQLRTCMYTNTQLEINAVNMQCIQWRNWRQLRSDMHVSHMTSLSFASIYAVNIVFHVYNGAHASEITASEQCMYYNTPPPPPPLADYAVNDAVVLQYALEITQWTCMYTITALEITQWTCMYYKYALRDYAVNTACMDIFHAGRAFYAVNMSCIQYALEITQWTCMYTIRIRDLRSEACFVIHSNCITRSTSVNIPHAIQYALEHYAVNMHVYNTH